MRLRVLAILHNSFSHFLDVGPIPNISQRIPEQTFSKVIFDYGVGAFDGIGSYPIKY